VPGEQEELRLVAGDLLVVVADPVDCDAVAEVLGTALDHSHEGEDAEDIERREDGEGEDIEGGANLDEPSATRALETERMYSEAREALSLAVCERAPWSVKCSVVRAVKSSWRSGASATSPTYQHRPTEIGGHR
jgi:hypothetical protein